MTKKKCYQAFILDFKDGDYVVYINVTEWGKCTVAKVTGGYQWKYQDKDFNHRFPVDQNSVYTFDRNDAFVHPALSSRLKLQGRWWRIYLKDEFAALLEFLKKGATASPRTPDVNLQFLSKEIKPLFDKMTKSIHHTHPNYNLEYFFEKVFEKIPGVVKVERQGGAGDHGADILVTFREGLPIPGLEKESSLVVQIKSYEGEHWDTGAVEDIKRAFGHHPKASMGLIISTADSITKAFEEKLDKLRNEGKPVALLVGADVAAFWLKYGANLLA